MSNKRIDEDIRKRLRAPFPPEAVSVHPTKPSLSTLKAIYVIERLNDVFGIGEWTIEHEVIEDTPDHVVLKGRLIIAEPFSVKTSYQYGACKKSTEPADAYKSAVTNCLSKCASYLEIGIDVFKGLHHNPQQHQYASEEGMTQFKEAAQPIKEMLQQSITERDPASFSSFSEKQWQYILKIGAEKGMTESEVVDLVNWVAKKHKVPPRHWRVAKLLLPVENFERCLDEFSVANSAPF